MCLLAYKVTLAQSVNCECDTFIANSNIKNRNFNRIPLYDTATFTSQDFFKLDKKENRKLWYRDVESIDTTKFTRLWNDYAKVNYHASHLDFIKFYENKIDIEIAFQFGPNFDLWAYHIFIVKKIGCCFLITRSYFRHARFTYKAYSIINQTQLDSLYTVLEKINKQPVTDTINDNYSGYFIDNKNKSKFFIDFESETEKNSEEQNPKPEIMQLYDFVDKNIIWTKTYSL